MSPIPLDAAAALIRPRDTIACNFATGQPPAILEAIGRRTDLEDVVVTTGILVRPYALLTNPAVRVLSAFFGPIERMAQAAGGRVEFLARDFHGVEQLALRVRPRVVVALTTPPDADGWLSFGAHAGALYRPFVEAARDPERVAIAEINRHVPRVDGLPEFGRNRVHVDEVTAVVEGHEPLTTLPDSPPSEADLAIAERVLAMIRDGSTLQFGIGGVPNEIATRLAAGPLGDFGVHTEMVSDGVMKLHQAGKVTNRKGLYDGITVATFALGSAALYAWLDGNRDVRMLPVSATNEPSLLGRLRRFVSVNAAMAVDLLGQVAADHVAGRQYSGVGGHEAFVQGASEAPDGTSILCLKSTATVAGTRLSTIVPTLPAGMTVTTPRHHPQWIVTEHGAVDLSPLGDRERARALVEIAHPDFRAELRAALP